MEYKGKKFSLVKKSFDNFKRKKRKEILKLLQLSQKS